METKVVIDEKIGFTDEEAQKLESARAYLQNYINTEDFKNKVLNFTWLGKAQFADNNGLSNAEIYNLVMSGKEVLTPTVDNVLNVHITIYNAYIFGRSTVGYGYADSNMQFINRRFYGVFTFNEVAGNIFHEYCHKLGFEHDFKPTAKRPFSIPYALGEIVVEGFRVDRKEA